MNAHSESRDGSYDSVPGRDAGSSTHRPMGAAAMPVALCTEPAVALDDCGSITRMIDNVREFNDSAAATLLFKRYFDALIHALQRNLPSRADKEEIASYALSEALLKLRDRGYPNLANRRELWALLMAIAELRSKHLWRYWTAACRDVRRERSLSQLTGDDERKEAVFELPGPTPTPDFMAALGEQLEQLYGDLDEDHRAVLLWQLEGCTDAEIQNRYSERAGHFVTERTICRKRKNIRRKVAKRFGRP